MFGLIRKWVADAVVAGFGDGLERVGAKLDKPDREPGEQAAAVERLLEAPKAKPAAK